MGGHSRVVIDSRRLSSSVAYAERIYVQVPMAFDTHFDHAVSSGVGYTEKNIGFRRKS